ncbi:lysylphosphatidylglycerol synthase domain-containing protein [Pseudogemmobacter humi]|uniref:Phosphatidylglycerol lysyltransferase n=1 Tax=Pseudogemmobacter humi TaxID=2483812 RepID=A0A3P5XLI6_9RHOB|nr:lysylphosphatidylglycerol synthase domain-containing protein [Pseudogemmobacter humi]VDC32523.1 Phosphatidylglycerol lysyltransferase [Pseudogemmobacter humi]
MAGISGSSAKWKKLIWPTIGLTAIAVSFWFLAHELQDMSWQALWAGFAAITPVHWGLIVLCTLCCYVNLALYDVIALQHLKKRVGFGFVTGCALTTYSLAHTIGASAFTGAVIRYRAYTTKGLSGPEVGVLVTFCSLTFSLAVMIVLGVAFLVTPDLGDRLTQFLSPTLVQWLAAATLMIVVLYLISSALGLPDLRIRNFHISYPRLPIALKQVTIAPVELLFAAGILYFALPAEGNPGYMVVMGVFVVGFSLALLSHAPGGLGVFELAVITGLPEFEPETVLAALLVFRMFYLIFPLILGLILVALFEHGQLRGKRQPEGA